MSDDFEIVGDAAREARVVAMVLGEASDFEREEVERLCEENPELQVFRRRMEAVHGLIGDVKDQTAESKSSWKLSKGRREEILAKLGEKETIVAGPKRSRHFLGLNPWQHAALIAVACVVVGLLAQNQMKMEKGDASLAILEAASEMEAAKSSPPPPASPSVARSSRGIRSIATEKASPLTDRFEAEADLVAVAEKPGTDSRRYSYHSPSAAPVIVESATTRSRTPEPVESFALAELEKAAQGEERTTWGMQEELGELAAVAEAKITDLDSSPSPAAKPKKKNLPAVAQAADEPRGGEVAPAGDVDPFASDIGLGGGGLALMSEEGREERLAEARVVGRSNEGPLLEQRFRVPPTFFSDISAEEASDNVDAFAVADEGGGLSARKSTKDLLSDSGIDFPEGASAYFDDSSGELVVRNTANNMDLVGQMTESLGTSPSPAEEALDLSDRLGVDAGFAFSCAAKTDESSVLNLDFKAPAEAGARFGNEAEPASSFSSSNDFGLKSFEGLDSEVSQQIAAELLTKGRDAFAEKDYGRASLFFSDSLDALPRGSETEVRRKEIEAHLADGSVALAQQYQRTGQYEEAKKVLEGAVRGTKLEQPLEDFDDAIRTNPSVTAEHSQNVDEVRRLLYKGEGLYNLGDYDQSEKEFHKVLRIDPYNKAARRWLERNASIKSDYYRAAYDQTRAQLLMEVDKAWELTVPGDLLSLQDDDLGLFAALERDDSDFSEMPKNQSENADVVDSSISRRDAVISNKLQNIIIPRIDFENTPLDEAMEYLTQKAVELDPDPETNRKGLGFVIEKGESDEMYDGGGLLLGNDPSSKVIDRLQLKDVPLGTALEYITSKTGLRYRIDDGKVTLLAIGSAGAADLVTRSWTISPEAYAQLMEPEEAGPFVAEQEEVASEKEALENNGVAFPEGASARYIVSSGTLVVRSTTSNLDLVAQVVDTVSKQAEVAKETSAMGEKDAATEGDSTFSLHVSDVSFKLAKAALEQGKWPETVRVEEFVNAFSYGERVLEPNERVGVAMEQAAHPSLSQRNLLRVALQTAATGRGAGVPLRLTVVLDKSGSMERLDRAAAVNEAFRVLVDSTQSWRPRDLGGILAHSHFARGLCRWCGRRATFEDSCGRRPAKVEPTSRKHSSWRGPRLSSTLQRARRTGSFC